MNTIPVGLLERAATALEQLARHFDDYVQKFDEVKNWPDGGKRFDSPSDYWHYDNADRFGSGQDWIRAMNPALAPALAVALRDAARRMEKQPHLDYKGSTFQDCMVTLASTILGEAPASEADGPTCGHGVLMSESCQECNLDLEES